MEFFSPATITLLVLAVMAIFFVTEVIPLAVTAMSGAMALGLCGVITPQQVFSGLSNSTVVLFAGMFVIGTAMFHTGLAQKIGASVVRVFGTGDKGLMFGVMLVAAVLSSFSSNTGTTAALMPVVIAICSAANLSSSRHLMPLAFAAGLGGTMTLVGTPPNILANAVLTANSIAPFHFFEFALIGIPVTVVGMAYMMLVGNRLLPNDNLHADDALRHAEDHAAEHAEAKNENSVKMLITGLTLLAVIAVMALDIKRFPLEMVAVAGSIVLVLTGCISEEKAYRGIDWVTIFLFAGMMPVAIALDKSGAGKIIADNVIEFIGNKPSPYLLCTVLFILSAGFTQFMSNTASAALLCPLGLSIAVGIDVSPHAVIMSIAIAASCAFATPVGTPPNTLVLGAGNYRFMDYMKVGAPLVILEMIVCSVLIPIIWPF
ncbi:MAG: divalent anion:sodium(Na+) symporter [Candidatus Desulfovibrio kirbyi]|jgi:anion transporter|uniref:Divalent anion:sodium(Na+) symporter n=1 Tax=Candidatus Desulfovibrio kirbyi TaxID=2696086 RepID=A0A6L2R6B4_9BACT|nr:SLC13 family permease [Desulfovibrio sp.]GFH62994.1 MAG: divalent anion:sodium(Na+) symporter [Candidatus Desulfovibrio kirbyi]